MDYFAQLTREIGQNQLPYNPCKLLDFELLVLAPAERISGTAVQIALPGAPSDLKVKPYLITPDQVKNGVWGYDNHTRNFHQILVESVQPELPAKRLIVGETYTPSGNWSTYPAHKHEVDNLPHEACHEEMYYFRVAPDDGFGITRIYHTDEDAANYTVKDNSILMIPDGYHTYVGAPGFQSYYFWFLAGEHRTQAVQADAIQTTGLEMMKK